MSSRLPLRFRYVCGEYTEYLLAVLVLVAAVTLAGAGVVGLTAGESTQTIEQTNRQTVETTLSTSITASGNTSLYDAGERLSNGDVYLFDSAHNASVTATTRVEPNVTTNVTHRIQLVVSVTRDGQSFYNETRTLRERSGRATNGSVRTTATLPVDRFRRTRLAELTDDTGTVGAVSTRLRIVTAYDTGSYEGYANVTTPLRVEADAYEIDAPVSTDRVRTTPVVEAGPTPGFTVLGVTLTPAVFGWFLASGLAFSGAVVVYITDHRIEDFDRLKHHYETVRYADWISRGTVPESGGYVRIHVESLIDIVDVAIDSEKRVIHDAGREVYAVVDGNLMYEYREASPQTPDHQFGLGPLDAHDESDSSHPSVDGATADTSAASDTEHWPEGADSVFENGGPSTDERD